MSVRSASLADTTDFIVDGTHGSPERLDNGVPVLSAQNVSNGGVDYSTNRFTSEKEYAAFKRRVSLQQNDVLLTIVGTIGRAAVVDHVEPAVFQRSVAIIRPNAKILDARYLYHITQSPEFVEQTRKFTKQSTQAGIYLGNLKKIEIPLPPVDEQKRIAAILDKADQLRQKRRQGIALLDSLARARFLKLFGDLRTNSNNYRIVEVGDVTDCIVPGRDKPKSFTGTIPWITTGELNPLGYTSSSNAKQWLSQEEISAVRAKVIPSESVILTCVGDLGTTSIAREPMVINQQLHSFQCSAKIVPEFLMYALTFKTDFMFARATKTTLPYMNKSVCNSIPVPLPPLERQQHFRELLREIQHRERAMKLAYLDVESLFNSLRHRAFSSEL